MKSHIRKLGDTLSNGESIQLAPDQKIVCFMCDTQIKYTDRAGDEIAIPASFEDTSTGEVYDDVVCLVCAAKINKETNGEFLGVASLEDLEIPSLENPQILSN